MSSETQKELIIVVTKNNDENNHNSTDVTVPDADIYGDHIKLRIITPERAQQQLTNVVPIRSSITKSSTLAQLRTELASQLSLSLPPSEEESESCKD